MLGLIGEAISLRSFSSLWYWAAVAAFWIWATGRVLGLRAATLQRAQGSEMFDALVHFAARNWLENWQRWQLFWVAGMAALLVSLTLLAFFYGFELAQALWFLITPYALLLALQLRLAAKIGRRSLVGDDMLRLMYRFRIIVQLIGFAFIFITVIFAFLHLLVYGFL